MNTPHYHAGIRKASEPPCRCSNFPEKSANELTEELRTGHPERRGEVGRMRDHNAVLRATGDRRAAIRAYCAGNRWLEENAKAVGNW